MRKSEMDKTKLDEFKANILHYRSDDNYIEWMMAINDMSKNEVLNLTRDNLIHGYCEDFAVYFSYKYDIPMLLLGTEHDILKVDGKYYDGYNIEGVSKLTDLQYVKESPTLSIRTNKGLTKLLEVDEEWKSYKPLSSKVHLIKKY